MSEVAIEKKLAVGWNTAKLSELSSLKGGFAFKSKEYSESGIPILRMGNITKDFRINWNKRKQPFYPVERKDEFKDYLLTGGELIICLTDMSETGHYLGTVALNTKEALLNQRVSKFQFDEDILNKKFLYFALCNPKCRHYMISDDTGSLQKNTSHKHVLAYELDYPESLEQQKRIVSKIEELFSHIDAGIAALNKAKQLLKQYRQSVLKAAVTGELTKHLPSRQAGWRDPLFRNKCGKLVPKNSDKYFAYVLECENGSLYKGFSKNLYMRIDQHLSGQGAKWTKEHKPVSIIHFEEFETEKEAIEREKYFKSGSGREWINEIRDENNRRFEPASQLLERILQERRQKWEAQQLEQFKAKGKVPKDDGWKGKYKEPLGFNYDGELPEIPDTWSWASPEQLASTDKYALSIGPFGSNLKVPDYRSSGVPLVFVRNIRRHEYGLVGGKFVTSEKAKELKAHAISGGDVLITKMGEPPGDASIYPAGSPDAIITADCIKWRFSQLIECPQLYVHATNSWLIKEQVVERTKGVAQKKISLGTFKSIAFPLAPLAEQQEILGEIEKKILSIARLEQDLELQLMKAEKNKQSILASAFSGEL
jgi:predicted GIY-YIG superfamily endonuclease/restriction endonuclease S subunit